LEYGLGQRVGHTLTVKYETDCEIDFHGRAHHDLFIRATRPSSGQNLILFSPNIGVIRNSVLQEVENDTSFLNAATAKSPHAVCRSRADSTESCIIACQD
jgi:hypothetical protein